MTEENANRITSLEDSLGSYLTKRSEHDELIEKAIQLNQEYINMTMLNVRSPEDRPRLVLSHINKRQKPIKQ